MIRKILYVIMTIIMSFLIIELISSAVILFTKVKKTSGHLSSKRLNLNDFKQFEPRNSDFDYDMIIHPYLGFVFNPDGEGYSEYGFYNQQSLIQKKSPDKVIIGIFGGSVAKFLAMQGGQAFVQKLKEAPQFHGKDVILLNLAVHSYKQPQQLLALNFFLSLGAEFDMVINIDGYNEIVGAGYSNISRGVFPYYPKFWDFRLHQEALDIQELGYIAQILTYDQEMENVANLFNKAPLKYSPTAKLINNFLENILLKKINIKREKLYGYRNSNQDKYAVYGPKFQYQNQEDLIHQLTQFWERCSVLMARVSKTSDIQYFHFLQPSQYVEGAKPLSSEERELAIVKDEKMASLIKYGYSLMQQEEKSLHDQGIGFYELTRVFENNPETIYIDSCCHVNELGNKLLAEAIAQTIIDHNNTGK